MNDFSFQNTTKVHFGKEALSKLSSEVIKAGHRVLLVYGGSTVKRVGLYDRIVSELKKEDIEIFDYDLVIPISIPAAGCARTIRSMLASASAAVLPLTVPRQLPHWQKQTQTTAGIWSGQGSRSPMRCRSMPYRHAVPAVSSAALWI